MFIIGLVINIVIIAKIICSKVKALNQTLEIKGFFVYNGKDKRLISVPQYKISTDMNNYLTAAFCENPALKTLWEQDDIAKIKIVGANKEKRAMGIVTHAGALFVELLEYCVIEKLSTQLCDFFNNNGEKSHIREMQKSDIPDILLQNRFLKLFSEDMINRAAFVSEMVSNDEKSPKSIGKVVYATNSSGAIYSRFDLVLPQNSSIKRKSKNEIVIDSPLFCITISCLYGGFGTVLPCGFYKYYLGLNSASRDYRDYQFNVNIDIKFKLRSFFQRIEIPTIYGSIDFWIRFLNTFQWMLTLNG